MKKKKKKKKKRKKKERKKKKAEMWRSDRTWSIGVDKRRVRKNEEEERRRGRGVEGKENERG